MFVWLTDGDFMLKSAMDEILKDSLVVVFRGERQIKNPCICWNEVK
jgi:hypothetical protein